MTKRERLFGVIEVRISPGEYVVSREQEIWDAREYFISLIREVERKDDGLRVLGDLRDDVFVPYSSEKFRACTPHFDWQLRKLEESPPPYFGALRAWQQKWNLPDWMLSQALTTLWCWKRNPWILEKMEPPGWWCIGVSPVVVRYHPSEPFRPLSMSEWHRLKRPEDPVAPMDTWDPFLVQREVFQEQVMSCIREQLKEYCDRMEKECVSHGAVNPRYTKPPNDLRNPEHFEWLVRYQVQGWSTYRIAKEYHVTKQAVTKALKEKASILSITLRESANQQRQKRRQNG